MSNVSIIINQVNGVFEWDGGVGVGVGVGDRGWGMGIGHWAIPPFVYMFEYCSYVRCCEW